MSPPTTEFPRVWRLVPAGGGGGAEALAYGPALGEPVEVVSRAAYDAAVGIAVRFREERDEAGASLTADERRALLIRIDGSQTVSRLPGYKALLASARAKLEDGAG